MSPQLHRFAEWLRARSPHAATPKHYLSDLQLFFTWAGKEPAAITPQDVAAYLAHCERLGHARATLNRRLASLSVFYHFLALEADDAPANPVRPRLHFTRSAQRLPRDVSDADLSRLFAVITDPRDRAMFRLMLDCGLRNVSMVVNPVGQEFSGYRRCRSPLQERPGAEWFGQRPAA